MRYFFYLQILLLSACHTSTEKTSDTHIPVTAIVVIDSTAIRLQTAIKTVNQFLLMNNRYNNNTAFFVDMKLASNRNRFFVVDLSSNKILHQALVAHGVNSNPNDAGDMYFSNQPNSYCTSLGKYRIGKSYTGNFGKSYRLIGLESSNNKALERAIVLHQYACVPDSEQNVPICNSLGCPMVSPQFFSALEKIIDQSSKSILLNIYY